MTISSCWLVISPMRLTWCALLACMMIALPLICLAQPGQTTAPLTALDDNSTSGVHQLVDDLSLTLLDAAIALLTATATTTETEPMVDDVPLPPPLDPPTRPRPVNPTIAKVLATYGDAVRREYQPLCRRAGIRWPPRRLTLLAF